MDDKLIEYASRTGRDFADFMKGETDMVKVMLSAEEFTERLRLHGCVNHHFVNFMLMKAVMKVFDDKIKEEQREARRKKRMAAKGKKP